MQNTQIHPFPDQQSLPWKTINVATFSSNLSNESTYTCTCSPHPALRQFSAHVSQALPEHAVQTATRVYLLPLFLTARGGMLVNSPAPHFLHFVYLEIILYQDIKRFSIVARCSAAFADQPWTSRSFSIFFYCKQCCGKYLRGGSVR